MRPGTVSGKIVGSDRVLAVLLELAEYPNGVTLDELAKQVDSPKPTIHRALGSLRRAGLAQQSSRGVYELGDEFVRLAYRHQEARSETVSVMPLLHQLAEKYGETAHYAVLDRPYIVYRAKVDPPTGAMRLTSTVGGRNPAYSTAVGKLLLSLEVTNAAELDDWLGPEPLARHTGNTITDRAALLTELRATRERRYGIDDQENEVGVNCVAFPAHLPGAQPGAVSISALTHRRPLESLIVAMPSIRAMIASYLG